jgi:hypothetical protein
MPINNQFMMKTYTFELPEHSAHPAALDFEFDSIFVRRKWLN